MVRAVVADAFVDEPAVADLVDALRSSPDWIDGLSFVAELDGRVVAHILFSRALLDAPPRLVEVLELGPVGVAGAYQGQGDRVCPRPLRPGAGPPAVRAARLPGG